MTDSILLTSFDIWEPHHISNSSDDLLAELVVRNLLSEQTALLRSVPVDFDRAPAIVLQKLADVNPRLIICCGMAESRDCLTLESNGKQADDILHTRLAINSLVEPLELTAVSHDAGSFVCNHLYYSVLKHIRDNELDIDCLFVHVPLLNEKNMEAIVHSFFVLLQSLHSALSITPTPCSCS